MRIFLLCMMTLALCMGSECEADLESMLNDIMNDMMDDYGNFSSDDFNLWDYTDDNCDDWDSPSVDDTNTICIDYGDAGEVGVVYTTRGAAQLRMSNIVFIIRTV